MNLMIVDDDIQIREGIQYGIDWDTIGISRVKSYGDGVEALEDYDSFGPQIILADIRMPAMDGLEFLRQVKMRSREVKVILISAYSDFEYCQKAVELGASGYELKPLKVRNLIQKIQEMAKQVRTEAQGKEAYERYVASYREKVAGELLSGRITDRNVILELLDKYFGLENARNMVCMVMEWDGGDREDQDAGNIKEILRPHLREDQIQLECEGRFIILAKTEDSVMYTLEIQNHLKTLWYRAKQRAAQKGLSLSAGVSGMVTAEKISTGYDTAVKSLSCRFFKGPGSFKMSVQGDRKQEVRLDLPPEYEEGLKNHDLDRMLKAIDGFGLEAAEKEITDQEQVKQVMLSGIVRLAWEMGQNAEITQVRETGYLSDFLEFWKEQCRRIMKAGQESSNRGYSANIRKALAYIHQSYDRDLLAEEVAAHIGKSPNYFSSIFRAEVGMTFREYLNRYRIERATELITESDMMIYEIAEKVGYSDYTYFSQVYKKLTGLSPTTLRGREKGGIS